MLAVKRQSIVLMHSLFSPLAIVIFLLSFPPFPVSASSHPFPASSLSHPLLPSSFSVPVKNFCSRAYCRPERWTICGYIVRALLLQHDWDDDETPGYNHVETILSYCKRCSLLLHWSTTCRTHTQASAHSRYASWLPVTQLLTALVAQVNGTETT